MSTRQRKNEPPNPAVMIAGNVVPSLITWFLGWGFFSYWTPLGWCYFLVVDVFFGIVKFFFGLLFLAASVTACMETKAEEYISEGYSVDDAVALAKRFCES